MSSGRWWRRSRGSRPAPGGRRPACSGRPGPTPAAPKAAPVNSTRGRRGPGGGAVTSGLTAAVAIRRSPPRAGGGRRRAGPRTGSAGGWGSCRPAAASWWPTRGSGPTTGRHRARPCCGWRADQQAARSATAARARTPPPMAETVSRALIVSTLSVGTTPGMADWPSRPETRSGKAPQDGAGEQEQGDEAGPALGHLPADDLRRPVHDAAEAGDGGGEDDVGAHGRGDGGAVERRDALAVDERLDRLDGLQGPDEQPDQEHEARRSGEQRAGWPAEACPGAA